MLTKIFTLQKRMLVVCGKICNQEITQSDVVMLHGVHLEHKMKQIVITANNEAFFEL